MKQCSNLFAQVFDSHGGVVQHKCACGKTHFDGSSQSELGTTELENFRELASKNPSLYMEHNSSVSFMEFAGFQIVHDCTCNIASKYEDFIRSHSRLLAEYLRCHAKELREQADAIDVPSQENGINSKNIEPSTTSSTDTEPRPDIRLEGTESIQTFGGEAWIDDDKFDEYGINFDKISIHGLTPTQMVQLAQAVVDHLLLCGHHFRIVDTNEQDQKQQLVHYRNN